MEYQEYKVKVYNDRTEWLNSEGQLHREDGPAIEWANGHKEWFLNDKRHREDGPAVERADSYKSWWLNGKRHREDGPAIEWSDGRKEWWLNGEELTEEEYRKQTQQDYENLEAIVIIKGEKYKLVKV